MRLKIYSVFFILSVFQMSAQDVLNIKIYREQIDNRVQIYADNEEFAPVSMEYTYAAENMSSSLPEKSILVIPPHTKKYKVTELKSINPKLPTKFKYDVYYVLGDINVKTTETDYAYTLPFEKGKKYIIYQGYNGKFSHQDAFSLDFSLTTGDKVFASRAGKVVQVIAENNQSCESKECAKFNNKIVILHSDGTLAEYIHLKEKGSVVKNGDDVTEGQLIGYSGNTGWSKGPHLHFSVFTNKIDGGRNYFKTKFKVDGSKAPVYISENKTYSRSN